MAVVCPSQTGARETASILRRQGMAAAIPKLGRPFLLDGKTRPTNRLTAILLFDKVQKPCGDDLSATVSWPPFDHWSFKRSIRQGTLQEVSVVHAVVRDLNGVFRQAVWPQAER
nr:hypothetical protein [Lignipirellula cremea]